MSRPGCVYRMYDKNGALLYVGCTVSLRNRLSSHANSSPWFSEVETTSVKWFATREEAAEEEHRAIHTESPRYNVRKTLDTGPGVGTTRKKKGGRRDLVALLVGGDLAGLFRSWRAEGLTLDEMAVRMQAEHDIRVTRETVRRWCHELDVRFEGDKAGAA